MPLDHHQSYELEYIFGPIQVLFSGMRQLNRPLYVDCGAIPDQEDQC